LFKDSFKSSAYSKAPEIPLVKACITALEIYHFIVFFIVTHNLSIAVLAVLKGICAEAIDEAKLLNAF